MQIWEQEFAWTEADKPIKLAARALTAPPSSSLNMQPMFCFLTMMKMWYWSGLVYDHQRVIKAGVRSWHASFTCGCCCLWHPFYMLSCCMCLQCACVLQACTVRCMAACDEARLLQSFACSLMYAHTHPHSFAHPTISLLRLQAQSLLLVIDAFFFLPWICCCRLLARSSAVTARGHLQIRQMPAERQNTYRGQF